MDYLAIANAPIFWALCGITVVISLAQALLFMRQAKRAAVEVNLEQGLANKAFKIGLISAIGAAATELSAATMGAQAAGVEFGGNGYTLTVMAVSWFAMALNGAGWLLVSGTVTPALEKLRGKLSGGDAKWLAVLSGACSLGIFGYLNANEIKKGLGSTIACLAGALSMVAIMKLIVPKHPKLAEYSLGIAMVIGMFFAVMHDLAVA